MRVLELHSPVKIVQRSQGRTATAAAAYRSATRIHCERTGETHDYRRKKGVEHSTVLAPADAPEWALDRSKLWNAAELREKHPRAQPARDLEVSFPSEFNADQRREAGLAIGRMLAERHGVAVDLCWHNPGRKSDERNHHLHVLFTTRRFENGAWAKTKDRTFDDLYGKGKAEILNLRQGVADVLNDIAARDRLDVYVEHLSYEKRGLDLEATQHMGPVAAEMERDGVKTDIGEKNRAITARNTERKKLREQHKAVAQEIAHVEKQAKVKRVPMTDDMTAFYRDNQARRRALLEELEAKHGQQEKEARQALAQFIPEPNENIIGQWRKLTGETNEERKLIARHRATLEAIEQERKAAFDAFESDRQARLEKLKNPEQEAELAMDERVTLAQQITAIYRGADSAKALQAALAEAGFILAQGKRVVLIDREGVPLSLARQIEGVKEKDVRARLTGLELPDADDIIKRLEEERAKQHDLQRQAQEAEPMEPKQAENAQAGREQQQGALKQEFETVAQSPDGEIVPIVYAHLSERQRGENERLAVEGEEARRRLNLILDQRYGLEEQRLRGEIEALNKPLQGASALKVRALKLSGKIPQDAEDKLARLREEQALIEACRRAAAELLEKAQRENEEAIRRRQEQEREAWHRRAPQVAQQFKAATQAPQPQPEPAPGLTRTNRATSSIVQTRLQKQQWEERFKFSDDAVTERHRLIRSLELQYKMTDRDRQMAGAYGHARQDDLFEAHKQAALEKLETSLKEREQALKTRHEQERQSLAKGIAPAPSELAQEFERHAPRPMEIKPVSEPQRPEAQTQQQPKPQAPAKVQLPTPELRPPGTGKPAQQFTPAELAARRAYVQRQGHQQGQEKDQSIKSEFERTSGTFSPAELAARQTYLERQNRQQEYVKQQPQVANDNVRNNDDREDEFSNDAIFTPEELALRQASVERQGHQQEQEQKQSIKSEFERAGGLFSPEEAAARETYLERHGGGIEQGIAIERE